MATEIAADLWGDLGIWHRRTERFGRCILHIGTEKTGSTSLQHFLGANRRALLQAGIFVPACLSPYDVAANHERLTTFALADDKLNDDLRVAASVCAPEQVAEHRASVTHALRAEVASLPADLGAKTLLLSNEHCHSRLVERAEVVRLRTFLGEFAQQVRIVVYLRPQHELAVSLYDQALKGGYADVSVLPDFSGRTRQWVSRSYFDYADLLGRWSDVFGRDAVDVRIYHRSELANGSVVDDFADYLELSDIPGLSFPKSTNISMGAERQIALNAINRLAQARGQPLTPELRATLIEQFQQTTRGGGLRPSRHDAEAFFQSFALSNEQVRSIFMPQRDRLFMPDFTDYPDTAVARSEADALAATVIVQQQTINQLKARLRAG